MTRTSGRTALVLGGGGITGIAWEVGILVGLARAGVDVTDAETVVGTSAGSVVGSQVTSGQPLESLYAEQLAPPDARSAAGSAGWPRSSWSRRTSCPAAAATSCAGSVRWRSGRTRPARSTARA